MLHSLNLYRESISKRYSVVDITMIIGVRLHEGNPWISERLTLVADYYDPLPNVIVVDLGSAEGYRKVLQEICGRCGFEYAYVDDPNVYCLSKTRNIGAAQAKTDLLFFNDADFFGSLDFFARIVELANSISLGSYIDQIINIPAYHLTEAATRRFLGLPTSKERSSFLLEVASRGVYVNPNSELEFIAPYSNVLMCHRQFYDYIGGYNENFRGYGSEDFEFLLRFATHSGQFPLPKVPHMDLFGPLRDSYYLEVKGYKGFRRLAELVGFLAEAHGLRMMHLHHTKDNKDSWRKHNDVTRTRLESQFQAFHQRKSRLLDYDWMPRPKRALVLLKHEEHFAYFLPLRLCGYRLQAFHEGEAMVERDVDRFLQDGHFDAVAIFNPYMQSHVHLRKVFDRAVAMGIKPIVIERGMLPESWYYAHDIAYLDEDYARLNPEGEPFTENELAIAREYLYAIRKGSCTLEACGSYGETWERYKGIAKTSKRIVFIPLQLSTDTAVTCFNNGFTKYEDFLAEIRGVLGQFTDCIFLVKPHPLSKEDLSLHFTNVITCKRDDNIHALLEMAEVVICYNSGVGFLALLHMKRLFTIGNAFYNISGFGERAAGLQEALAKVRMDSGIKFNESGLIRYFAWLLFRKYSFMHADTVMKENRHRFIHNYSNFRVYSFTHGGVSRHFLRSSIDKRFAERSYASGHLGIVSRDNSQLAPALFLLGVKTKYLYKRLRKLFRDPKRFLANSRYPVFRWLARLV